MRMLNPIETKCSGAICQGVRVGMNAPLFVALFPLLFEDRKDRVFVHFGPHALQ